MEENKRSQRYERIYKQIEDLTSPVHNPVSRMATTAAILHHKMDYFFWTGFYLLNENSDLLAGPYQGPLACLKLQAHKGVCWAGIDKNETIIVENVETFPGHIACNSKSKSEIVIPLHNQNGKVIGVMDIDSKALGSFNEVDQYWLEKICQLIGF